MKLLAMTLTAAAGLAVCSLCLLSGDRPVLTVGAVAAAAVLGAVLSGLRWLGSAAVLATTATALFAATVSGDRVTGAHLVASTALLLCLVTGLDRLERTNQTRPELVTLAPVRRRLLVPLLALAATVGVALAASLSVVPSVGLVLLGLAAGVAALMVATST